METAALLVSLFSAIMQSLQTWDQLKGTSRSDVLTRQLTNQDVQRQAEIIAKLVPQAIIDSLLARVQRCFQNYKRVLDAPPFQFSEEDVDAATMALKACVCRELARLKAIDGDLPPDTVFVEYWWEYQCTSLS